MSNMLQFGRFKIPLICVGAHTFLILVAFGATFVCKRDSGLVYAFIIIVMYILDYPIGVLFEALRPVLPDSAMRLPIVLGLYLCLGGILWFCLGYAVMFIIRWLRKNAT